MSIFDSAYTRYCNIEKAEKRILKQLQEALGRLPSFVVDIQVIKKTGLSGAPAKQSTAKVWPKDRRRAQRLLKH